MSTGTNTLLVYVVMRNIEYESDEIMAVYTDVDDAIELADRLAVEDKGQYSPLHYEVHACPLNEEYLYDLRHEVSSRELWVKDQIK